MKRATLATILLLAGSALAQSDGASDFESADPAVREAARRRAVEEGPDAVPRLEAVLREGTLGAALEVIRALAEIGTSESREALHGTLASGSLPLRRAVAAELGRTGDFRDVDALAAAIATTPLAACHALGEIGHRKGVAPLEAALAGGELPAEGRVEALAALVRLGVDAHREALIAEVDGAHGRRALVRLREIAGTDAGDDAAAWSRWWTRESLARLFAGDDPDAADARLAAMLESDDPTAHVEDLLVLLADESRPVAVRSQAARGLGLIGDRRAVDELLAAYAPGQAATLRLYAVEALGRIGDPRTAVPIARQVATSDPDRAAARLGSAGPYEVIDIAAAEALVRMGLKGGLRVAVDRLRGDWWVRMYYESLHLLWDTTGQRFDFRPDQSGDEKRAAAMRWYVWFKENREAIDLPVTFDAGDAGFRAGAGAVVDRLNHFKMLFTMEARSMLMVLGEPVVPMLEAAIRARADGEEQKRRFACEVLGEIGIGACVPPLVHALESDPDESTRVAAAVALGDMALASRTLGDALRAGAGLAALRAVVRDASTPADVLLAAIEALGLVSDDPADAEDVVAAMARLGEAAARAPEIRLIRGAALARLRRAEGLDELVELLGLAADSTIPARRGAAAVLREVTGHDFGYEATADDKVRAEAAGRWRERVTRDRSTLPRRERRYVKVTDITAP